MLNTQIYLFINLKLKIVKTKDCRNGSYWFQIEAGINYDIVNSQFEIGGEGSIRKS